MKTQMHSMLFCLAVLSASALLAPAAHAAGPVWTHAAGACVIDKSSATAAMVQESELKFDGGAMTEIVARCNVVNAKDDGSAPLWKNLEVVYRDQDGPGPAPGVGGRVRAILKRVSNAGASATIATFDSNWFPATGLAGMNAVPFAHAFSFSAAAYWVEIRIQRSGTAYNPAAFLVRLRE